jgi:hypothetical protein
MDGILHRAPLSHKSQAQRRKLPISQYRDQIVDCLETSQVLVLSGETGWSAWSHQRRPSLMIYIYSTVGNLRKFQHSYLRTCSLVARPAKSIVPNLDGFPQSHWPIVFLKSWATLRDQLAHLPLLWGILFASKATHLATHTLHISLMVLLYEC